MARPVNTPVQAVEVETVAIDTMGVGPLWIGQDNPVGVVRRVVIRKGDLKHGESFVRKKKFLLSKLLILLVQA